MEINMENFIQLLEDRFDNNQAKMARILRISRYRLSTVIKNREKNYGCYN